MSSQYDQAAVYHILAFCFANKNTADQVAKEVRQNQKLANYKVVAEAVVEVDEKGKTHVHEPGKGGVGTTIGLVTGGLLGLIGGPAGLLAWTVAGGVIGGVAGKFGGRLIPVKDLKALGEQMDPNSSAFLALVEDTYAENVITDMQGYNANVVTLTVGDEASGEIAAAVSADIDAPVESDPDGSDQADRGDAGKS
jgi:uncharacterized membrane protein